MDLDSELIGALSRQELVAFFQPQFAMGDEQLVGVETLSRWRHPLHGLVLPGEYIEPAEESGTIHQLGAFMIVDGCRCAARWVTDGTPIEVSVNVSAVQLASVEFFDAVEAAIDADGLEPRWLTVEVTESRPILDMAIAMAGLERLRRLGVGISIDDVGVGYSSLRQVTSLPSTEVKIDRSLIQSERDESSSAITEIVGTAHGLGIRVVAEGIETTEQYDRARELGCDRAQGFLLGRPLPESETNSLLEALVG